MKHILLAVILSIFAFAVYAVPVTCPNCKGTGYEPGESKKMSNSLSSSRTPCSMCKGKKKVEPKISKVMGMELGAKYPDFQNIMPPGFPRDQESGLYLFAFKPKNVMQNSADHIALVTPSGVIAGVTFRVKKVPGYGLEELIKSMEKNYGKSIEFNTWETPQDELFKFAIRFSHRVFYDLPFSRIIAVSENDNDMNLIYLDKSLYEAGAKEAATQAGVSSKGL